MSKPAPILTASGHSFYPLIRDHDLWAQPDELKKYMDRQFWLARWIVAGQGFSSAAEEMFFGVDVWPKVKRDAVIIPEQLNELAIQVCRFDLNPKYHIALVAQGFEISTPYSGYNGSQVFAGNACALADRRQRCWWSADIDQRGLAHKITVGRNNQWAHLNGATLSLLIQQFIINAMPVMVRVHQLG